MRTRSGEVQLLVDAGADRRFRCNQFVLVYRTLITLSSRPRFQPRGSSTRCGTAAGDRTATRAPSRSWRRRGTPASGQRVKRRIIPRDLCALERLPRRVTTAPPRRCAGSLRTTSRGPSPPPSVLVSPTAPTTAFAFRGQDRRPLGVVTPQRRRDHPRQPRGPAGDVAPSDLADEDGLPTGIQVLAPRWLDDRLYSGRRRPRAWLSRPDGADRCCTERLS